MNKIRSSRMIEQETKRNIELMWLTSNFTPDHGTISGFIKDNRSAIKELFKDYVLLLKGIALIEGNLIAISHNPCSLNMQKYLSYHREISYHNVHGFYSLKQVK